MQFTLLSHIPENLFMMVGMKVRLAYGQTDRIGELCNVEDGRALVLFSDADDYEYYSCTSLIML